ncbi:MAG: M28 family peptidase [Fibrobacteria bacterium]|nr:M28 family peptidase [Fibrobacteria bacterium]
MKTYRLSYNFLFIALTLFSMVSAKKVATKNFPYPFEIDSLALYEHVRYLSELQPARSVRNPGSLLKAITYIESRFAESGVGSRRQSFRVEDSEYHNIVAVINPSQTPIIVLGAHYDVCNKTPGADDNASGVAGIIELAGVLHRYRDSIPYQVQLVAYANEEPPFFRSPWMGSYIHAKSLVDSGQKVEFMASLEMIGYFTEEPRSQDYPSFLLKPFYPSTGNFIAVISNYSSGSIRKKARNAIRRYASISCRSISAPGFVPGIDMSDHLSYWKHGIKAIMITDTSFFRNKNYHTLFDTIETLNFSKMKEVVKGIAAFVLTYGK